VLGARGAGLALVLLAAVGCGERGPWLDDLAGAPPPRPGLCQAALAAFAPAADRLELDAERLPERPGASLVFLSAGDETQRAHVVLGRGSDLREAVRAAHRALEARRRAEPELSSAWLKLDLVAEASPWRGPDPRDSGRVGLAHAAESGLAWLPGEVAVNGLLDEDGAFDEEAARRYLALRRPDASLPGAPVYRFRTQGCFASAEDPTPRPLLEGQPERDPGDPEVLLAAARAGGDYLARTTDEDGRFRYLYRADRDALPDGYNILRHGGTLFSMLELYAVEGSPALRAASERAAAFLAEAARPCPELPDAPDPIGPGLCIVEDERTKLGGNGLAVLAFVEYLRVLGDDRYLEVAKALARRIVRLQRPDGRFWPHIQYLSGEFHDHVSGYYPGEAIFALARLEAVDPDGPWKETADRNVVYLRDVRDHGKRLDQLIHDHWLLYGLSALDGWEQSPEYYEYARRLVLAIVAKQRSETSTSPPRWVGSFYTPPRSTPTATRMEGLAAAFWIAERRGDGGMAWTIRRALQLGVGFQLRTQVVPASALYLPAPHRALGGFRSSLRDFDIRNDYVQHNVSALLGARRILLHDERARLRGSYPEDPSPVGNPR